MGNPPSNGNQQQPPVPSQQEITHAQSQYGLHNYQNGQSPFTPLLNIFGLGHQPGQVDTLDPKTIQAMQQGLYKRTPPTPPSMSYLAMNHQALYDSVQNVDPGQLGDIASSWQTVSDKLIDATQGVAATALAASEAGWTGTSANNARQAIATLTNQAGATGQAAAVSAQLYHQQSTAAQTAKNTMPKPPTNPYDPQAAAQQLATITDPAAHATAAANFQQQQAQQNAAHQQAATIVQTYDKTVTQTSASQPGYAPPPVVAKPTGGTNTGTGSGSGTSHNPYGTGGGGHIPGTGGGGGSGGGGGGSSTSGGLPVGPVGPVVPPVGVAPPGGGTTVTQGTGNGTIPGTGDGNLPGYGNSYGNQNNQNNANNFGGGMFGPMGGGGGGFGGDTSRSGSGYGGSGRFGSGGLGSSGSESAGSRGGIGAGAAEEAAMRGGAAGARGATGTSGMGGAGGRGGGKKQDDAEHKTASYLLEPDAEGIFGTDEKTVPPVIG